VETDIVASRMRERVIKGIAVTNEEAMQAFLKEERKYNLSYIAIDPKAFEPSVRVDAAELKAYFEKNPSDFIVPVRIKAFYAFLGFKEFSRGVKVTDDGVKAYYGLNKGRFYAPPQALARHILITPDGADADREKAKNDARAKAEEILRRVKSGESFASLAKKYSKDTVSAEAGGGLGWFPRGVMVREFEDAVFSLKKGEVSGIVETQFGFHIILLEDKREAREQPLEEVEAGIRETLAKDKGNIAARDAASDLEKEFRGAASIEGLSRAVSAKPGARHYLTAWISEAGAKEDIVRDEKTRFAVFSLKAGEVSAPVETDKGIYVVKAVEREEARVPEFAAVMEKVKERVRAGKAREEARNKAGEILKSAIGGADFGSAVSGGKMKMDETGWFTRAQGFARKIGLYVGDKEKIFELTEKSPYYPAPVEHNGKYYLFKLKSTLEADPKGFPLAEDALRARLMTEKQEDAVHKWLTDLRSKAKIKVFEERL
ncbi:MAG: peptidylprolyl isomerase, partial [Deltaproteobacteria bacterium]|nr:peptidylprolyl isomerase [Deltaproteobacteria bacterium]